MTKNTFDWLKDGVNKTNEYVFNSDLTYTTSTTKGVNHGKWNIINENTVQFINKNEHTYTL